MAMYRFASAGALVAVAFAALAAAGSSSSVASAQSLGSGAINGSAESSVSAQVAAKKRELQVQKGLEKEKDGAALQAEAQAADLRTRVANLQKEADVAAEIAKEKSEAAAKAEKARKDADEKAKDLRAEEKETSKFVAQTSAEVLALERQLASSQAAVKLSASMQRSPRQQQHASSAVTQVASAAPAAEVAAGSVAPPHLVDAMAVKADLRSTAKDSSRKLETSPQLNEVVIQRLEAENQKLRLEKEALQRSLTAKQAAQEKEHLRHRLRSKLLVADREQQSHKRHQQK